MQDNFFIFDIETSWLNRFAGFGSSTDPVAAFQEASLSSGFRKSRFFLQHEGSQLLEAAASGDFFIRPEHQKWTGFSPSGFRLEFQGSPFRLSRFSDAMLKSRTGPVLSSGAGPVTEETAGRLFFQSLKARLEQGPVTLAGWNPSFDLSFFETLAHRYESLSPWRGFLGRSMKSGSLKVLALEQPLLELAWEYARTDPRFRSRRTYIPALNRLAESPAELRRLPVWSAERVLSSITAPGWDRFQSHTAAADVRLEQKLYEALSQARRLAPEAGFDEALRRAGLIGERDTASAFFHRLFAAVPEPGTSPKQAFSRFPRAASAISGARFPGFKPVAAAAAAGAAALVSAFLVLQSRYEQKTQIEGFQERGLAKLLRQSETDFGSGWRGFVDESESHYTVFGLLGGWTLSGPVMQRISSRYPEVPRRLFEYARSAEWKSPAQLLRILRMQRRLSSYLPSSLTLGAGELVVGGEEALRSGAGFALSQMGLHLQHLAGEEVSIADLLRKHGSLQFVREDRGGPYLRMMAGRERTNVSIRFMDLGVETAVSGWRAGLRAPEKGIPAGAGLWERLRRWRANRYSLAYDEFFWLDPKTGKKLDEFAEGAIRMQPYLSRIEGKTGRNLAFKAGQISLEFLERANRLLNEIGIGIKPGTYSSASSLFGKLMMRRVLPAALLWTGLRYADYLTGHAVSDAGYELYARARVAHAELTDRIPGWRRAVEWNEQHLPGPSYAPLALPAAGATAGALLHWGRVLAGRFPEGSMKLRRAAFRKFAGIGALAGLALAAPFVPGMLGSRRTAEEWRRVFAGEEPVEVRSGRWWDLGSGALRGRRILAYRPHRYVLHKTRADMAGRYGSEEEYWAHHPLIHPIRYLKDPYWLEKKFYSERPYPAASPAFSNVPLIGPLLAATVGRLVKPPLRMHEGEWDPQRYQLFSDRLEKSRTLMLPPSEPKEEFRFFDTPARLLERAEDLIGLRGFFLKSLRRRLGLTMEDSDTVYLQGSRQMDSLARRYYEMELGAMSGVSADGGLYGFSEPLRRFIQRDDETLQVNDIPNRMPDWLPGSDYFVNFRTGDPYIKIPQGHIRLPGPGYEALHPHLKGVDPADYPELDRFAILADVAPWSKQYYRLEKRLAKAGLPERDRERFEQIRRQAQAVRQSTVQTEPRLRGETRTISGTVESAGPEGVRLKEYPGRLFRWSGLDLTGSAYSAAALGERNADLRQAAAEKRRAVQERIRESFRPGSRVQALIEASALASDQPRAVFFAGGENFNRRLVEERLAAADRRLAGPEWLAGEPAASRILASYGESVLTTGRKSWWNPLRWLPWWGHAKFSDSQDAYERYVRDERMELDLKRWDRPVRDFLFGWVRGLRYRITGAPAVPSNVRHRDDLDLLVDQLKYLQGLQAARSGDVQAGRKMMESSITGADLTASPIRIRGLLGREGRYFERFAGETDPERQQEILASASPKLAEALLAQWGARADRLRAAEGKGGEPFTSGGRFLSGEEKSELERRARKAGITPADALRAKEIARFFSSRGLRLPVGDPESERTILDPGVDPEDVKVKILKWEGKDLHEYGVYRDRASLLWRKPWLDGIVRELTSGDRRSEEEMRRTIEKAIAEARNGGRASDGRGLSRPSHNKRRRIYVSVLEDETEDQLKEVRRNRDLYAA